MQTHPNLIKVTLFILCSAIPLDAEIDTKRRTDIIRQITAEYGTAKVIIPRSKKALIVSEKGYDDEHAWGDALSKFGPAAQMGDLVQITKVTFRKKRLILVLNHGLKGGRKWWHRIQIGSANTMRRGTTLGSSQRMHAPGGTKLALVFKEKLSSLDPAKVKQVLEPLIDFTQRSATELYIEKLPEKFREAISGKRVVEGMDREMVLLVMGRPDRKIRDFENNMETEDWIYGIPPGNLTFITFEDEKVIDVQHTYAAPGGTVGIAQPPTDKK